MTGTKDNGRQILSSVHIALQGVMGSKQIKWDLLCDTHKTRTIARLNERGHHVSRTPSEVCGRAPFSILRDH